jgi:hypothetical protein
MGVMGTGANASPRQMQQDQPSNTEASKPDTYDHDCYYIAAVASSSKGVVGSRAALAERTLRVTAANGWLLGFVVQLAKLLCAVVNARYGNKAL